MIRERARIGIQGRIAVSDADTGDGGSSMTENDVHRENMACALAAAMTNTRDSNGLEGFVNKLCFGDGGSFSNSDGQMVYRDPNATGHGAALHSMVYEKIVDYTPSPGFDATHTRVSHEPGSGTASIRIMCVLEGDEPPAGKRNSGNDFVFDEIGVVSQQGRLLTHSTFQPIRKLANRRIRIEYTLDLAL